MRNNDLLRSLRWTLDASEARMAAIFALGDAEVEKVQIESWLKREEEPSFTPCPDSLAAAFLAGLIIQKRGPSDKKQPPVRNLGNNLILKMLRIAFTLRDDDLAAILRAGGFPLNKSEISALFRTDDHPNYRPCGDQVLRNFLRGLALRERPGAAAHPG